AVASSAIAFRPLSLHDALPILLVGDVHGGVGVAAEGHGDVGLRVLVPLELLAGAGVGVRVVVLAGAPFRGPAGQDAANLDVQGRSEEHTSELQSRENLVCRLLL